MAWWCLSTQETEMQQEATAINQELVLAPDTKRLRRRAWRNVCVAGITPG